MHMLFAVGASVPIKYFNRTKLLCLKRDDVCPSSCGQFCVGTERGVPGVKLLRSSACRPFHWQLLDTAKPKSQGSLANETVPGAHSGDAKTAGYRPVRSFPRMLLSSQRLVPNCLASSSAQFTTIASTFVQPANMPVFINLQL